MRRLFLLVVLVCCPTSGMGGSNALDGHPLDGQHFEGDIAMRSRPPAGGHSAMLAALRDTSKRWPGGRVPYRIDTDSIPNVQHHQIIRNAMNQISEKVTCIKFVENEKLAKPRRDYVRIAADGDEQNSAIGCWSYLGMVGGEQTLNLDGNCFTQALIVHELLHVLSFIHEQNRSDRDDFVEVRKEHIKPGMEFQFMKRDESDVDDQDTPYDFRSRLHYPPDAFSKSGDDTIVALYPGSNNFGPLDNGLSPIDVVEVSLLYDCAVENRNIIEYIHENRLANEIRIEILAEEINELAEEMENIKLQRTEEYFGACVNNWCRQIGTTHQYTRCEEAVDGGLTCLNPTVRYGSNEGGIPGKYGDNNFDEWCQQLLGFGRNSRVTYGPRDCAAPRGRVFWSTGYDEPAAKWCDNIAGKWKDGTLDSHSGCDTDAITSLTCSK